VLISLTTSELRFIIVKFFSKLSLSNYLSQVSNILVQWYPGVDFGPGRARLNPAVARYTFSVDKQKLLYRIGQIKIKYRINW